jgi:hypothetical protein
MARVFINSPWFFLLVGGSAVYQQLPGRDGATNEPVRVTSNFLYQAELEVRSDGGHAAM